jgi:hypothetical protein
MGTECHRDSFLKLARSQPVRATFASVVDLEQPNNLQFLRFAVESSWSAFKLALALAIIPRMICGWIHERASTDEITLFLTKRKPSTCRVNYQARVRF